MVKTAKKCQIWKVPKKESFQIWKVLNKESFHIWKVPKKERVKERSQQTVRNSNCRIFPALFRTCTKKGKFSNKASFQKRKVFKWGKCRSKSKQGKLSQKIISNSNRRSFFPCSKMCIHCSSHIFQFRQRDLMKAHLPLLRSTFKIQTKAPPKKERLDRYISTSAH